MVFNINPQALFEEIAEYVASSKGTKKDLTKGAMIATATDTELSMVYKSVIQARETAAEIRRVYPVYAQVAEAFSGTSVILVFPTEEYHNGRL